MSQLRSAKKRPLPFMAMGLTVPVGVGITHSYPLPKVPRFQVRLESEEILGRTQHQRPVHVDAHQGDYY